MTVRSLRRFVSCLSITRLPVQSYIRNASMSFGEQRMAMEGRCGTCHVCFERMSVLLQDDHGAERNGVRRSFPDRAHRRLQGAPQHFSPDRGRLLTEWLVLRKHRPDPQHSRSTAPALAEARGHQERTWIEGAAVVRRSSAHPFMDDEAARDCQFPQRAEKEFLRLLARIAPRCQLEIPERPVVALERGAQYCGRLAGRLSSGGYCWGGYSLLP